MIDARYRRLLTIRATSRYRVMFCTESLRSKDSRAILDLLDFGRITVF